MSLCSLCPRSCGADRAAGDLGFCGVAETALVCRAAPHFGEEPCLSGTRGSGAVFFAGCSLRCVYCQNREISRGAVGRPYTAEELRTLFLSLRDQGVHNLDLVTPTHFSGVIAAALDGLDPGVPVVWNSSGYERVETLRRLEGLARVYLPDLKYMDAALAKCYSAAPDYPEIALAAIREMYRQTGPFTLDGDGLLRSGVLIRHLVLPGAVENTRKVIDAVEENFPPEGVMFSLMAQYTPMPGLEAYPELCRPVSAEEYDACRRYLERSGVARGYVQDLSSTGTEMIPEFEI